MERSPPGPSQRSARGACSSALRRRGQQRPPAQPQRRAPPLLAAQAEAGPRGSSLIGCGAGRCHVGGSGASPTVEIDRGGGRRVRGRRVRGRRLLLLGLAPIWALRGGGRRDGEKPDEPAHRAGHALLRQGRVHEGAGPPLLPGAGAGPRGPPSSVLRPEPGTSLEKARL